MVRLDGQDHYLGSFGSPESFEAYERQIADWRGRQQAARESPSSNGRPKTELSINRALLAYDDFISSYYVKEGRPTKEQVEIRLALRPLRKLYGSTLAKDFGPKALKAVRTRMVADDLSRGVVNNRINRVKMRSASSR